MFGLGDVQAPPVWLSAAEAGDWLGVSSRRVRVLLAGGHLDGRQGEGGRWEVSRLSVVARIDQGARPVRPLSPRGVRLLADAIAAALGEKPSPAWAESASRDRYRAADRLARLAIDPDPVGLARAWVRNRRIEQDRRRLRVPHVRAVLAVPGVRLSGVSHPLSRVDAAGEIEVHAPARCLAAIEQGARTGDRADSVRVWIHCSDAWSAGDVVFDLIEHEGARESADAARLLAAAAHSVG